MKIERMKVNRLTNPMGCEMNHPSLSWTVTDTNAKKQESARITVALDEALSSRQLGAEFSFSYFKFRGAGCDDGFPEHIFVVQ